MMHTQTTAMSTLLYTDGAVDMLMLPSYVIRKKQLGALPMSIFNLEGLRRLELDGENSNLEFANASVRLFLAGHPVCST